MCNQTLVFCIVCVLYIIYTCVADCLCVCVSAVFKDLYFDTKFCVSIVIFVTRYSVIPVAVLCACANVMRHGRGPHYISADSTKQVGIPVCRSDCSFLCPSVSDYTAKTLTSVSSLQEDARLRHSWLPGLLVTTLRD